MPNPDVKAVRAALEEARCTCCSGTGSYQISDMEEAECSCSALERRLVTVGLEVCDKRESEQGLFLNSQTSARLNLIAEILLPKEGA